MERKLEEVGELHARELKRERDAWAAAEKIRREQWMAKVRLTISTRTATLFALPFDLASFHSMSFSFMIFGVCLV